MSSSPASTPWDRTPCSVGPVEARPQCSVEYGFCGQLGWETARTLASSRRFITHVAALTPTERAAAHSPRRPCFIVIYAFCEHRAPLLFNTCCRLVGFPLQRPLLGKRRGAAFSGIKTVPLFPGRSGAGGPVTGGPPRRAPGNVPSCFRQHKHTHHTGGRSQTLSTATVSNAETGSAV